MWIKYNPNPVGNYVEDCVQRAMSAALGVSWDDASDIVHEFAKNMGLPEHNDAVWGAVLRKNGFYRKVIPNSCPDCYTVEDFCADHPHGVYVLKVSNHVVTIIDGNAYDSWNSLMEIPQYYWYRKEE